MAFVGGFGCFWWLLCWLLAFVGFSFPLAFSVSFYLSCHVLFPFPFLVPFPFPFVFTLFLIPFLFPFPFLFLAHCSSFSFSVSFSFPVPFPFSFIRQQPRAQKEQIQTKKSNSKIKSGPQLISLPGCGCDYALGCASSILFTPNAMFAMPTRTIAKLLGPSSLCWQH